MLQNNMCFCIDLFLGNQVSLLCNFKCFGNEVEDCGGVGVISVYRKGINCWKCELFFQILYICLKLILQKQFVYYLVIYLFYVLLYDKSKFKQKFKNFNRINVYREKSFNIGI